ncbi:hypothetical protein [Umezawaea sp. Da 62-37]|uniref:hypothetical protein n=1 Tax=Umezawaea sp. Da 62-37 TaxID=3075927 RepID=UPI0028F73B5E|nr:hypothetical protein [Umezawaea sp. Da 62-37]WNV91102.1 hypothetical protein RM788_23320 [Umezawaea sp. Da 62-37]
MTADRDLLDALAAVLDRIDPVPPHLAGAALFHPPTDTALMTLLADSALTAPAGVRGDGGTRTLRFTGPGTTVDLRLDTVPHLGVRTLGLVSPAVEGSTVQATWPTGTSTAAVDRIGGFHLDPLPAGPLRFVLRRPARPDLGTGWFVQ